MRLSSRFATLLAALLLVCLPLAFGQETSSGAQLAKNYGNLPLSFEANQGQAGAKVRFLSRGNGYSLLLTDSAAVLALTKHDPQPGRPGQAGQKPQPLNRANKTDIVRMELAGAIPNLQVAGADPLPGKANYFIGSDPSRWHSNVPTYGQVKYTGVYPGVDLVYYGNQRQLEYDFVVAPGADTKPIRLQFEGAKSLKLASNGDLSVSATDGEITFHKPVIYQTIDGKRLSVEGKFSLLAKNKVGFSLGQYDHAKPLVIDPVLVYSTYLGGTNGGDRGDYGSSVAVDSSGNVYITGTASSTNFPLTQYGYQLVNNDAGSGANAFVTKLNSTGTALIYSTYLGGNENDYATAIAVDSSGDAYVAGAAGSTDFPVILGALQQASGGGVNAFLAKLNPTGSALLYSTYLGGNAASTEGDYANAIAVDGSGDVFLTGRASSSNFPVTSGAYQATNKNYALGNAFVAEINPAGTALLYATYLGGSRVGNTGDSGNGIAIDSAGNAYVTGSTYSTTFPTTFGVYSMVNLGQENAFVTKLNSTGTALVYSTYLGGNYADGGSGIGVDGSGDAYVTGVAGSEDFPTTTGAFQPKFGFTTLGGSNAFVTKLNPTGTQLLYSTYLGGNGEGDLGNAISLDKMGDAYVTGKTQATNFPVTKGAYQTTNSAYGSSAFLSKLDPTGSTLLYSTYLGGSGVAGVGGDLAYAIAIDGSGDAYITGRADSTDFPVTTGAYQTTNRAAADESSNAFVAKLAIGGETTTTVTSSANPQLYGFPITFTAAVTANFSNAIPTGNAVFRIDGGTPITVALDGTGKATYESSSLTYTPGSPTHTILASYSGDSNFLVSNYSLNELIIGPPHSIVIVSGSGQSVPYGSSSSPLVVIVKDINGNPVPNATVTWSGSGLQFSANPVTTGSNGEASVTATAEAAGSLTATASVTGVTTPASFTLTATKVLLTVTANNVSVIYNQPIPALTYTVAGFVNGDTLAGLSGAPSETTTAVKGSTVGSYLITISQGTLAAANYIFNLVNGTLTITQATPAIVWPAPAAINVGTPLSATQLDATANVPGTFAYTPGLGTVLNVGTQTLSVTFIPTDTTDYKTATATVPLKVNPPSEPVGTISVTQTATITLANSFKLGSIGVVTQGASNLDFNLVSGGTCTVGASYIPGQLCTVNYTFKPTAPGTRTGAINLYDTTTPTPVLQARVFLSETGTGPEATFLPGTVSTVVSGLSHAYALDVNLVTDGSGNLFVADYNTQSVYKETPTSGIYTQTTAVSSDTYLTSLAIDSSGSLYLGGPCTLYKDSLQGTAYLQSQIGTACDDFGMAVDNSGNIFIAAGPNGMFEQTLANGQYTQSAFGSGFVYPTGVAVDGAGNVYVADLTNNPYSTLYKETPSPNGAYTQTTVATGLVSDSGIAVDSVGNLYAAIGLQGAGPKIYKLTPSGNGYTQTAIGTSQTWSYPISIAVNAAGNVYVANSATYDGPQATVYKIDLSDPPSLSFANTLDGSTSSDSPQTVTVVNEGNAPLTFPIPTSGNNPKITANFTLNSSGASACPLVTSTSSTPGTLASGASCLLPISFAPTAVGSLSGSLVLTDNSLNTVNAIQTISLRGTGVMPINTTTTLASSLNPSINGQSVTFNATETATSGSSTPTGTVQFSIDGAAAGSPVTLSSGVAVYTTSTLTLGTHTIAAAYTPTTGTNFLASNGSLNEIIKLPVAATPVLSQVTGVYALAQSVTITDATPGATIYYTTNGSTPTTSSTKYLGVITVSATEAIAAIAVAAGYSNSAVASAAYAIEPNALQFIPVTPCRIADTRNATGAFGGPELAAAAARTFDVPQSGCNIPSSAVAYSLNVTVVPAASLGYLTIWPAGQAQPTVSTLNSDGRVKANATITPAGANGGVSVYASDATQFILDIDGYFVPAGTSASGLEFYPLAPCRIADTRNPTAPLGGPSLTGGAGRAFPVQSSSCGIPSTAKAYSLNITAVPHAGLGYLTTWPTGQSQPVVSTLNSSTGAVTANAAIVPAGTGGDISVFVSDTADVILDVNGYFAPPATGGLSLYTVAPCRALDTRNGAGAFDGTLTVPIHGSSCAPPTAAQAYVLNATVVPTASLSYLTLWAAGSSQPDVSTLNASDGAVTSNMAIVPTINGSIDAFATDSTQLILDLSSYFAP